MVKLKDNKQMNNKNSKIFKRKIYNRLPKQIKRISKLTKSIKN